MNGRQPAASRLKPTLLAAVALALCAGSALAQEAYGTYGYDGAAGATYAPQGSYGEPPPLAGGYYPGSHYRAPAPAYPTDAYAGTTVDDITVYAPRSRQRRSSTTGAPIEWVSISRPVSYQDLDLSTQWGVDELVRRVRGAARSACSQMDVMHPIATSDSPPCYRDAIRRAMRDVEVAIASTPYRQARW
jgi:UrcA family protein